MYGTAGCGASCGGERKRTCGRVDNGWTAQHSTDGVRLIRTDCPVLNRTCAAAGRVCPPGPVGRASSPTDSPQA
eukprot:1074153-Prymnesium_polylepis.1